MKQQRIAAAKRTLAIAVSFTVTATLACRRTPPLLNPADSRYAAAAPDSFDTEMLTTKGPIVVRTIRWWSPNGADRFHGLVRSGFFTDVAFHRTIGDFVAQFGISGDTAVSRAWTNRSIPDDTVRTQNKRGTMTFARGGPNSRSTQLYFNLVDNVRLDTANGFGFPPIGRIVEGLAVMDSLNWEYSARRGSGGPPPVGPSQDSIRRQGNAYLRRRFPRLDYIIRANVTRAWR
jgi:peptidyl-prolyl cis-trans isomerase A (cyclophilin A)